MSAAAASVRPLDPGLDWTAATIPGSTPDVSLVRLRVDPMTRASVSLVRFPPGWSRPGLGHYACAEEVVVLDGWIEVSGLRMEPGAYGWLPPRCERVDSRVSPTGCLAYGWFSDVPRWTPGPPTEPPTEQAHAGPLATLRRDPRPDVPGSARAVPLVPAGTAERDFEVLAADGSVWAWVPAGSGYPTVDGAAVLRSWEGP